MTYTTTVIQAEDLVNGLEQVTQIDVDFSDEGVDLQGSVKVRGDWQGYLSIFEKDMRNNHRSLFPMPEPVEPVEGEI
jgi:hypothetical protein